MKKINNNKRNLTIGLSLVLIIALAIGGTLAYLSMESNKKDNEFSFADVDPQDGLDIILIEPKWDGDTTGDENHITPTDPTLGENMAEEVQPGDYIPKDPYIVNTTDDEIRDGKLWVAMKMVITDKAGNKLKDADFADLRLDTIMEYYYEDNNSKNVIAKDLDNNEGEEAWSILGYASDREGNHVDQDVFFFYNAAIDKGEVTKPLFDHIYFVLAKMNNSDAAKLNEKGLQIKLIGYAIQEKNIPYEQMPTFFEDRLINGNGDGGTLTAVTYDPTDGEFK